MQVFRVPCLDSRLSSPLRCIDHPCLTGPGKDEKQLCHIQIEIFHGVGKSLEIKASHLSYAFSVAMKV